MSIPSLSMTSDPCRSRHHHSPAVKCLPSTTLTNRPPAPLTPAIASFEHPATRRPVPREPQPCHRSSVIVSPPVEHHCRGDAAVVSLHPPYRHPWVPLGPSFLPGTTFSSESPPAGRNRPVESHRRRGVGLNPLFQSTGPDRFHWVG
jgi:hypothetical protein